MENPDTLDNVARKRGRPVGKRRMPLSREQRKARNAQYERERRNEITEATCQLAEAAGFDQSVSVGKLLTSVIDLFENSAKRQPSDSIEAMKQKNEDMEKEIYELSLFLAKRNVDIDDELNDVDLQEVEKRSVKRKSSKVPQNRKNKKQCLEQNASELKTEFDFNLEENVW